MATRGCRCWCDCAHPDRRQSQYPTARLVQLRYVEFFLQFPHPKCPFQHLGKLVARTDPNALIHRGGGLVATGFSSSSAVLEALESRGGTDTKRCDAYGNGLLARPDQPGLRNFLLFHRSNSWGLVEPIGYASEPGFARPFRTVVNAVRAFASSRLLGRMSFSRGANCIGSVARTTLRAPWSVHRNCIRRTNPDFWGWTRELSSTTRLCTRRRIGGSVHHFRIALSTLRPLTGHHHALRFQHRTDGTTDLLHHRPRRLV